MTRGLPPLGARALRRTLASLDALAAPVASLCASTRALEVVAEPAAALRAGPRLDGLVEVLATLDGTAAPAQPAVTRPRHGAPLVRGARSSRAAPPLPEAPVRRAHVDELRETSGPRTRPSVAEARAAIRAAWVSAAPSLVHAHVAPPLPVASIRRSLPPAVAAPLARLTAHAPIADAARARPVTPVPVPMPMARPVRPPPPVSPAPRPRVEDPPPPPPRPPAAPIASAPAPRGLAGLATWWSDWSRAPGPAPVAAAASSPAVASGLVEPVAVAPGRALGLGALSPSQRTDLGGRSEREASSLAAISNLDDVARALERVLARELRRHGVTPEES